MAEYHIQGGFPITGSIAAGGNKNAALPCIAATLLTGEPVVLRNIPQIEDVKVMFEILRSLGVQVEQISENAWKITAGGKIQSDISAELSDKIRASILFAGPLLARTGSVVLPPPGGDVIGRRRLDTHFLALQDLGARVDIGSRFDLRAAKLQGADIFLD
ncbi:MAG: UDP-N-acetylglucosamine 1-carboxyvinyltransferase, partial [Spirochaetaceae bacterium]|nr:UDP-N-acetylglucosamine 1-carboxyvinyltransferase [Spirochaetaceae bacterium]